MNFLFPSFLWGLFAVTVPLAIHLFNFRRTKKVYFSNVALLKSVETQTSSFRRLKHLLVLLCRILAIAALVFAFAQPYLSESNGSVKERRGITSLYLDNSFSMQNEENSKRLLDIATSRLGELMGLFKNNNSLQLLTNDFAASENALQNAEKVRDRLTTISLSNISRTYEQVLGRQNQLLSNHHNAGKNQLFWFSDFQKSTAGDLSKVKIDSNQRLFLVPVQTVAEKNIFIDSVWLNNPFIRELQNNILRVKIRNSGATPVASLVVKLILDDVQVSTASVKIPAKGSADAAFNFSIKGGGFKKGKIAFDDFPVTFDNDYYFVLNASPRISITHLYQVKTAQDFISNVFQNDSLFDVKSYNINHFDIGQLNRADFVVMEGLQDFSASLAASLNEFVKKGRSLAIIPPSNPSELVYQTLLTGLGILGLKSTELVEPRPPLSINAPDRRNPFYSDVFEETVHQENMLLPAMAPVWQWSNTGNTLLSLKNSQLALSKSNYGRGKLYIFGAPLEAKYGNLAQNAIFVPIMYKMAAMSVRDQKTAFTFDENPIALEVTDSQSNAIYKLRRGNVEITPSQRKQNNTLLLELPSNQQLEKDQQMEPGYYEVIRDGRTEQLLALNHHHRESVLDHYSPEDLRLAFANNKNITIFDQISDTAFLDEFERQNLGITLWKYFLYAALLFLLLEILIIRFWK